jgi:hypothetical protein
VGWHSDSPVIDNVPIQPGHEMFQHFRFDRHFILSG